MLQLRRPVGARDHAALVSRRANSAAIGIATLFGNEVPRDDALRLSVLGRHLSIRPPLCLGWRFRSVRSIW